MLDRLIQLFLECLSFFRFWFILKPFEAGVVIRLGHYHRTIGPGGFHWLWPFSIEDCVYTNIVPETQRIGPQSLTTKDEIGIVVSTVITFAITDVKVFLLDIEGAEQVIEDATFGFVNEFIRSMTWAELRDTDINAKLTSLVRRRAKDFGVSVLRVQVADFTKCVSVRHLVGGTTQHTAGLAQIFQ